VIRRATAEDLEAAVAVWRRARWDAQPWLEERLVDTPEDDLAFFRDVVMRRSHVWLAATDEAVIALLALGEGEIDQLHVDPDRQGRGVGTGLLDHAKALSPRGLTLFTHQRNARARRFYEARGFRAVAFGVSPPPESEPDVQYAWTPGDSR
jgi:ribosomal protein S18 acetylase RimI-like enzyme